MKAPLRATDSSTIEKLRAWLGTELEPLEIDNNVQYAHHVVTIFLNDADVEDEPLSPPDDYLRELDNLRTGKSIEQKKKAAVQFLKGVIPLDKQPIPCLIGQLIDELVERVEATKVRNPRKLLGSISVNVEGYRRQTSNKKYRVGQERCYDEAFPSLPAESKMNNIVVVVKKGACADGWLRSSGGIENIQRSRRRSAARKITFVDKSEDAVCAKTGLLHLIPVPKSVSPVTIEVDEMSFETGIFSGGALRHHYESEWKSAFSKVLPTAKLYSPKRKFRFPLPLDVSSPARPNSWPLITIISNDESDHLTGIPRLADKVDLLDEESPKAFLHIEQKAPGLPHNKLFALDNDDLEISNIISWDVINREQMKKRKNELARVRRQERQITKPSRKESRNRQRNSSPTDTSAPCVNGNSGGHSPRSLEAAKNDEEVKTNDLIGFAMSQMAEFERVCHGADVHGGRRDAFDIVLPPPAENELVIHIGVDNDDDDDSCYARRGSADSGMCPGGEEESKINLFGWADDGTPSGWLEPASVWRKAAQENTMDCWRKTPGCAIPDDGTVDQRSNVHVDNSIDVIDQPKVDGPVDHNWNGWGDSIPIPGSSWDSMIRKDVFCLSTPVDNTGSTSEADICPSNLSTTVSETVGQVLQSAFVNSMFAEGNVCNPMAQIQISNTALDCSDLERRWLSYRPEESVQGPSRSRLNIVRGRTCSSWLEGVCELGVGCPFSHPSI